MSSRYTPVALLNCEPVVMPRITSRFVLGPVEEKLNPGTKPAKSFRSRALIWSRVPEVKAVTWPGTFCRDSDRRFAVTMTSASSVLDPEFSGDGAGWALCAAASDAQSDVTTPASHARV